jgi:nucleoside phosphorylase
MRRRDILSVSAGKSRFFKGKRIMKFKNPLIITPTLLEYNKLGLSRLPDGQCIISGVGMVKMAMSVTEYLCQKQKQSGQFPDDMYDGAILLGFAGSLNPHKYPIGTACIGKKIIHDIDCTPMTEGIGIYPDWDVLYSILDLNMVNEYELGSKYIQSTIFSSSKFITNKEDVPTSVPADIVDMESSAFVEVCNNFVLPYIVIRIVSDLCDHNSHDDFVNTGIYTHVISDLIG